MNQYQILYTCPDTDLVVVASNVGTTIEQWRLYEADVYANLDNLWKPELAFKYNIRATDSPKKWLRQIVKARKQTWATRATQLVEECREAQEAALLWETLHSKLP